MNNNDKEELIQIVNDLITYDTEEEWFEFKENWYEPNGIGEYISSMSNVAAMLGKKAAYFVWGINDKTHEIVGTKFDYHQDVKNEPLEHYLARNIIPDLGFEFVDLTMNDKKIVVLIIPAASKVPTSFNNSRYYRIGSSKVNLNKYPERESRLFEILRTGLPSLVSEKAEWQELSFKKLFLYYEDKGITLNPKTFKKNLKLLTENGDYNILAQLLSDDSHIPIRVSIFRGVDKASPLYSVREFGNNCLLISLDKVIEYADVLNVLQADESNRKTIREEISLFDEVAFREAIINAFVHNKWVDGNAPMITVYSDRIEILSRGTLAPKQTMTGFYLGESVPVNQELSDVFLQLHISERSGRGVPKITKKYGKDAYDFRENSIVVTIPFNMIDHNVGDKVGDNVRDKEGNENVKLNPTRTLIIKEMRNNPNITHEQLMKLVGVGRTAIQNNISYLRKNGLIERVGSNKNGWWKVL